MTTKEQFNREKDLLVLIGLCLNLVQQTEDAISKAVTLLLGRELDIRNLSDAKKKNTLSDFLRALKSHFKIDHNVKERLSQFLGMRNKFVHNFNEIDGWDLKTKKGREVAQLFLVELAVASLAITALFSTVIVLFFREKLNDDLLAETEEDTRRKFEILEKHLGPMAKKIMAGKYSDLTINRR